MRLTDRLTLLSAGYKKKEIEQMEKEELDFSSTLAEEKTKEEIPDYKTMYEELVKKNEATEASIKEKEAEISNLQAINRNKPIADIESPDYIGNILK